ncbi:hypothetical protein [Gluconacetobacter takamatsuzukensis]|uniref:O-antigen ligase-like membrane protein n=1 Tax=Gluconacetobacter takamatsuzukensis TaxID=1286190 RepID=A0A7W4KFI9_9PROT|nr:hypothetical protein [Gluconacetobacter takamatsuzukensis]MBB2206016.1 hypothetical protein [Gluconacetobacter takamatsuzukensis]
MGITLFFLVLAPLCLIWANRPERLIQLMVIMGIFEASAAITIGGFGIAPNTLPALTLVGYIGTQFLLGARYPGRARVWPLAVPLIVVSAWAILTSWLSPRFFEGRVYVWPQKSTPPFVITLLSPGSANLNQDLYLALNIVLFVMIALYTTRQGPPGRAFHPVSILHAYFASVLIAFGFGVWQFASDVAHVPFPSDMLYSNPGWSILTEQTVGSLPRINATFSEPSAFGGYMAAGAFCAGWLILNDFPGTLVRIILVASIAGVLLSTSATGIVSLAIGALIVVLMGLTLHAKRFLPMIKRRAIQFLILSILLMVLVTVMAPNLLTSLGTIFDSVTNKQDSESYNARSSTDLDSLQAAFDTFGLGVGWGNNRSSSLIPGLLAAIGIPGMLGLIWFGWRLVSRVRSLHRMNRKLEDIQVVNGASAALVGYLVPACVSAPTITSATFYVFLALLVSGIARAEGAQASRTPARLFPPAERRQPEPRQDTRDRPLQHSWVITQ